jgi:hypothetical protein
VTRLAAIAVERGWERIDFLVLEWNPARDFYRRLGIEHLGPVAALRRRRGCSTPPCRRGFARPGLTLAGQLARLRETSHSPYTTLLNDRTCRQLAAHTRDQQFESTFLQR